MKIDDTEVFELHAEFCKIIASSRRLRIIQLLAEKEMNVGDIAEALQVQPSNISQHLRVLRSHDVVKTRKEGQTVWYSLTNRRLPKVCTEIRSILLEGMEKNGKKAKGMNK
jgi:ArsR family transcriptional regulator